MRICIPVEENKGLDSVCYGHFGSAPLFCVVDTESADRSVEFIDNTDEHHEHGQCNPVARIAGRGIGGIIVQGMGGRAVQLMRQNGIRVFFSDRSFAVKDIFDDYTFKLQEMTDEHVCNSHHGCSH